MADYTKKLYIAGTDIIDIIKSEKAESAKVADSATKATQDASGNVISSTYATKSEVTSGLSKKLGKTEKASSANTADSVAWTGVTGKPNFATVATTGSYNDLTNKPSVEGLPLVNQHITFSVYSGDGNISMSAGQVHVRYTFPITGIARVVVRSGHDWSAFNDIKVLLDNVQLSGTNLSKVLYYIYDIVCYVKKGQQIKFVGNSNYSGYSGIYVEGYLCGG